jgi:hypothetical protein
MKVDQVMFLNLIAVVSKFVFPVQCRWQQSYSRFQIALYSPFHISNSTRKYSSRRVQPESS